VGEVVVTDLDNRCVPLIRYRLGDVARITGRRCPCGRGLPLIERIRGRPQGVVLGTNGAYLPATYFAQLFKEYEYAVQRYQVVQEAHDRIDVRIVRRSRFTSDTQEEIRRALASVLGQGMIVRFELVETIPVVPGGRAQVCLCRIPLPLFSAVEAEASEEEARREAAG
jgi:phenylacetate-CoA ligase